MNNDPKPLEVAAPISPAAAPMPARTGRPLAALALLGVGILATAAGYWVTRVYAPAQATIAAALASNDRSTTGLGGELRSLHERLRALEDAQQAEAGSIRALRDELAALHAAFAAPATSAQQWLRHARIEHLVKSAALLLREAQDLQGADAALAAAELELATGSSAEDALRTALARDRATLGAFVPTDVAARGARWAEIARGIDGWPWPLGAAAATAPDREAHSPVAGGWREVVASIWRDLRQLVEIRALTDADPGHTDPSQQALIKAGLKLEIGLLRAALAARDERAVRASAATLEAAIGHTFERTEPPVLAALAALGELSTLPLAPPLPTLAESLRALDGLRAAAAPAAPAAPAPPSPPGMTVPEPASDTPREIM